MVALVDAPQGGPLPWPPPGARPAPRQATFFERAPANPLAFGAVLFLVGWAGILFQHGVLRQLVVGAPLFEEMAKLGLALALVALLGIRATWLRMPFAWASGAAFGVLEHFLTYADEPALFWELRVAFHLATAGLSMAVYGILEPLPDARVRWATTLLSSAIHAANNLGALFFLILGGYVDTDPAATAFSALVTAAALGLTLVVLAARERARARALLMLRRVFGPISEAPRAPSPAPPLDPPGP